MYSIYYETLTTVGQPLTRTLTRGIPRGNYLFQRMFTLMVIFVCNEDLLGRGESNGFLEFSSGVLVMLAPEKNKRTQLNLGSYFLVIDNKTSRPRLIDVKVCLLNHE